MFWTPRILTILFAIFISLFALDVFVEGYGLWKTIGALLIHLIPSFLIIAILIFAWKWEWIGGLLFIGLGVIYILFAWGKMHYSAFFGISGPLFLVGILFMLNWILKSKKDMQNNA